MKKIIHHLPFMVLPILGMGLVLWANSIYGMGIADDSLRYLSMAKHVLAGLGVWAYIPSVNPIASYPEAHFAPFYALVLVPVIALDLDLQLSLWLLHGIFVFVNIAFIMFMLFRFSGGSMAAASLGAIVIALDRQWLGVHSFVLTEPLFLFLTNVAFYLIWKYLQSESRAFLIGAAAMIGAAALTRWVGIAFIVSGFLIVMALGKSPFKKRLTDGVLFGCLAALPFIGWMIRNVRVLHLDDPNKPIKSLLFADLIQHENSIHVPFSTLWLSLNQEILAWSAQYMTAPAFLTPLLLSNLILIAAFLVFVSMIVLRHRVLRSATWSIVCMLCIAGAVYCVVLIQSIGSSGLGLTFVVPRYVFFIFVYLLIITILTVWSIVSAVSGRGRALRIVAVTIVSLAVAHFMHMSIVNSREWSVGMRSFSEDAYKNRARWELVRRFSLLPPNVSSGT